MSRIGKLPITVPSGVDVTIEGPLVSVKGPKGTLSHTLADPITIERHDDGTLAVNAPTTSAAAVRCTASRARWSAT